MFDGGYSSSDAKHYRALTSDNNEDDSDAEEKRAGPVLRWRDEAVDESEWHDGGANECAP